MMLIKKNPSPFISCLIHKIKPTSCIARLNFHSSSENEKPPQKSTFMRDYLVSSCGLSPLKAMNASKHISHINSAQKPDSLIHFFKHHGFDETHIRKLVSGCPFIFCSDLEKTIQPNINALRLLGFTNQELQKIMIHNPQALVLRSAVTRIGFWKTFFKGDMQKLLFAFTRNRGLICLDIDKNVIPKISLFKKYGFSETDIGMFIVGHHCLIARSIDVIEELIKRSQEMGFKIGSKMFVHSLVVIGRLRHDKFKEKVEFFKSLGWSEEELLIALKKFPYFVLLSKVNLKEKMEFLIKCAGCTQPYIASRPTILSFSLRKRLMPRCQVMKILKSHALVRNALDFYSIVVLSEKSFLEKFILRYKDEVPTLLETYNAHGSS